MRDGKADATLKQANAAVDGAAATAHHAAGSASDRADAAIAGAHRAGDMAQRDAKDAMRGAEAWTKRTVDGAGHMDSPVSGCPGLPGDSQVKPVVTARYATPSLWMDC
ncbi:MAG: hypothetical protein ABR562_09280 [Thermoplasmatota archaeon]